MEVDDGNETKDVSSLIESALPTWKMLYNPLTTLLKDLNHAVDDLEYLLSEFLSFENSFSAIFVPRNNSSFNADDYEDVEQKYFSFTLWFQGSLFYLLTFTHLKKIHPLAVKLQIKILTVATTHPHLYQKLSNEYLKSLKTIQQSKNTEIKHFLTEIIELGGEIKLTPNFGTLTPDNENNVLLSLIEIIEYILRREINYSIFFNSFINDTWNTLIQIVNTSSIHEIQKNCLRSLNIILKTNCCVEKSTSLLETFFLKFIQSVKNLDYTFIDIEFSAVLLETLDIFKLNQHDTNILLNILHLCKIITKNCSDQCLIENAESLTRKILCENPFVISNDCEYIDNDYTRIAIEVQKLLNQQTYQNQIQLVFDLKLPVLNELIEKSQVNSIEKIQQFLTSLERIFFVILESTYMCEKSMNLFRIPKYFNEEILIKVVSKFQSIDFHKLEDELNQKILAKNVYYLIVLTNITNSIKVRSYLEWISNIQNKISNHPEIWLLTYIHCQQKEYLNSLKNSLLFSKDQIQPNLVKNIPFLIDAGAIDLQKVLNEWFKPWIEKVMMFSKSGEKKVKLIEEQETSISEALTKIICISSKEYIVVNYFDKEIRYEVICAHCKIVKDTENQERYWFNNRLHSIDQTIFKSSINTDMNFEKILLPLLKLFQPQFLKALTNMITVLTAVSFHYTKLITADMVRSWIEPDHLDQFSYLKLACENYPKLIANIENRTSFDPKLKEEIFDDCVKSLVQCTRKYLNRTPNDQMKDVQIIFMEMLVEFGHMKIIKNSTLISLKLLVHFALNIKSTCQEFACISIEDLAHALDLSNNQFYIDYKKDICKTIIELSVLNYVEQKVSFSSPLHKLSRTFGFLSLNDFIVQEGRYLLPFLIPWIVKLPYLKALLDSISDMTLVPTSELIANQFGNIYPHIFINETDEVYEKCMKFLRSISKTDVATLRRKHFRIIFNELLLYFHKNPERILSGLKILFQDEMDIQNNQEVIQAIQSRFLGLLVYFDSKLNSKRVAISDKRNALQSLPVIIKLIGPKQITPLRFKVMATLHTTLHLEDMEQLSCLVWDAFIKNCDIDAIGPLLSTVFTSLLPLHQNFPSLINEIFMYLVCNHEQDLCEHLPDLFFVIESNVNDRIKSIVQKSLKNYSKMNFRDQLQFYLKYLQHDNIEVRIHGVNFTTKLLECNRELLNELILGNNGLDPIVVELIDLLITGFTEKNKNYYLACSKCIGELGAMEPSHLPKRYANHNETFTFTINEDNFAIKALNELIRAFQSEKYSQTMDCFALAIQEILKSYNVNPSTNPTSSSKVIWNHFPENQQQIMQPLLTSRYKIAFQAEKPTGHPLFQSDNTKTFIDWIHRWIAKLIPLIKTESCRYLFDCCQPSLRKDMQVLMFFLPYILLHSLLEADAMDRKHIYEEMVTVFEAYKNKKQNLDEHRQFKPLKSDLLRYMPSLPTNEQMTLAQAAKVVYVLLDFLLRWLREWEQQYCPGKSPDKDPQYIKINSFMQKFCKLSIAQSNYNHEEFPRALMYLEDYVNENPNDLEKQLGFFTRIYVQLDDPDSVAGIRSIQQQEPLLEDMILSHEISGQLHDATACYERLAQEVRLHPQTLQGLIRCHLDLDNPYTAHRIIEGLDYDFSTSLYECKVETLWRLHDYDKLESVLNNLETQKMSNWSVNLGNILLNFHKGNRESFWKELAETRYLVVQPLSVSSRDEGSYENGYPQVMKLHLLNELEKVQNLVNLITKSSKNVNACSVMVDKLILEFDQREKLVQSSVRVLEPVYCLRRTALQQAQELLEKNHLKNLNSVFNKHIGNYWLKSAQVARVTGMYQQAYINLLNAEKYKPVGLFIEKAKLHWARGEQEIAFSILKRGIEAASTTNSTDNISMRKIIAEAKLLVALYNEETANLDMEANIAKYKEAVECNKECEMSMVYLARYYDKALSTMSGDKDVGVGGDMQLHMIHNFGKSLQYGKEFLYQSMPRMLSIWLDYGSRQFENKDKETFENKTLIVLKMTKLINTYLERLPTYMFLSAFSQIVSRICHPQKQVYQQLKSIIVKLIQTYPQQTLWMIMSVYKSSYSVRVKRCQEILQDPRLKAVPGLMTLIQDFNRLAEKLIELCNKPISNGVTTTSVSTLIKSLPRLITASEFSKIMVPVEQYLKMILPINNENLIDFNPYPKKLVYIIGIDETVTIMPSLQRPRRITLLGSDGKKYMHMLKPKDDLRKDFRLMEFNGVVNQFLYQESESRQRRLHIRTYAVVPLNEECGIIEWVSDLIPFRAIILKLHKQKNSFVSPKELRTMMCNIRDSVEKKRQVYLELLCPKHPLVFHEWFRLTFSDPYAWYQARTSYIRTTATISIVGYILGLGDRHGENILFDSTNGETVHVDFNCLFNRGQALEWPERVPFRLTPNMVKAMGPLGVEGVFRRSCEVTLRVLRSQKETLMSILKPFVYDPLVSWPKTHAGHLDANAERTNEQARDHVRNIESRLQGIKGGGKLPIRLSVEGHVNSLILDATSIDNLCQMYIGWGSFL